MDRPSEVGQRPSGAWLYATLVVYGLWLAGLVVMAALQQAVPK